jgi:hypothetical protein
MHQTRAGLDTRRAVISLLSVATLLGGSGSALAGQASHARPALKAQTAHFDESAALSQPSAPIRLQGKAEVQQQMLNPQYIAWQAGMLYRLGGAALDNRNYDLAAEYFKQAGDRFQLSVGEGKFLGESRFAEGQARRFLRQDAKAADLFQIAAEQFQKYDPFNPYLKPALDQLAYLRPLQGKVDKAAIKPVKPLVGKVTQQGNMHLLPMPLPRMANVVDKNVVLKSNVTKFENGALIASLKDNDFFTRGLLPEAAAVDVSDKFVHDAVYKAFLKMTCLESAALGGNYYTAPEEYKAFKADSKTVVVGASNEFWSPVVRLKLNGKEYPICMDLPGMSKGTKNVLLVHDGEHVLALDPRTGDSWKLMAVTTSKLPDFSWWKLTHTKKMPYVKRA